MNDVFSEELLSAYLDDELSADERARVENALEANSDLRRILDDLQIVSAQLQQLPRYQVGRDLSAEVLRKIEQSEQGKNERGQTEHRPSVSKPLAPSASKSSRRNLYWAMSAMAATVALVAFISLPLWRGSDTPGIVDKGSFETTSDLEPGDLEPGDLEPAPESAAAPLAAPSSAPHESERAVADSRNARSVDRPPRAAANTRDAHPSAAEIATADAPPSTVNVAPHQPQAPRPKAARPKAARPKAMTLRTATPQKLAGGAADSVAPMAATSLPPRADLELDFSGKNYVVRLASPAKVLRSGAFDEAVKRQEISLHLTGESQPALPFAQDHRIAKGEIDAVLVVATPPQIEDLLADLASRPDEFYPTAAYPIEYDSLLLWLVYLADASSRPNADGSPPPGENRAGRSFDLTAFFKNRTENGFAWRTPQPTQNEIDGFFPAPQPGKKPVAAAEKKARSVAKKVDLTKRVRVLFFLQATTAEQP